MPVNRFFVNQLLDHTLSTITLIDEEYQHLKTSRIKQKDLVTLIDGHGNLVTAALMHQERQSCELKIVESEHFPRNKVQLTLAQAYPRLKRLDYIIEKSVELGVDKFILFPGEKSEKKNISDHQVNRIKNIMQAALKQCGRYYLPSLEFEDALFNLPSASPDRLILYGDVNEEASLFKKVWKERVDAKSSIQEVIFIVGPESGLSHKEIQYLNNSIRGVGVKLADSILRTDTAPIVAMSLIQHELLSFSNEQCHRK